MKGGEREIRFSCQKGCSKCCEVKGYVYLTEADVENVARYLGLPQADFEARYIYRTRHMRRIRKPRARQSQCPFLSEGLCGIHAVKPVQCRLYPFWPELLETRRAWSTAGRACPGIGQGPLVQIGTALEMAHEMRVKYPDAYE